MSTNEKWSSRVALSVTHVAGMIDLMALPVWVGTLISAYKFDPQQAGSLVTLFLAGAVAASLSLAPRFNRLNGRLVATAGFACAAISLAIASLSTGYAIMATCHLLAGFCAGSALSMTHGTIGRSVNPHRLFAIVGTALGMFAIVFLGAAPKFIAAHGGASMFEIFTTLMLVAAVVALAAFPKPSNDGAKRTTGVPEKLGLPVWAGILGVSMMAVNQSMVFGFFQQIGTDRGFGLDAITSVFIVLGFINLIPAPLAAILENHVRAEKVVLIGPVVQATLALIIIFSSTFAPYAAAGAVYVAVMIFSHTYAFGLLSKLDTSGRAVAATPAMLMTGAAIGPILAGTLIKYFGYHAIGYAICFFALGAIALFSQARRNEVALQPLLK
ncbi:MFS transporter [Allorhizobium sp. BGMRC 0089]|uniref:MFS transporter n=1 Tax=Allorhizobium sonneratiae TaxID=2934936 RepID=UPI0020331E45|nr:MFS transporter [Allorhizobium sonneratiae]MCM2293803.1 MFS transporter [Allorhizobium sonneratiae]